MNNILVVVDMQNDFIDGVLGSEQAKAIVSNVVKKIEEVDKNDFIICTKDYHSKDSVNSYIELQQFPMHCEAETYGQRLGSDIFYALEKCSNKGNRYIILNKDSFVSRAAWCYISDYLNYTNKEAIITIVGLCTDICVISNALLIRSYFPENRVIVDASCCAGTSPEIHEAALKVMEMNCIEIINR